MYAAPAAELDDGLFDVVWCADLPKRRFLTKVVPGASREPTSSSPRCTSAARREVEINADRPFTVYADGDPLVDLPATVTILTRSLRVLAPPA